MTEQLENILDSKPVQITGKTAFATSIIGGFINLATQMEYFNDTLITVSSIIGVVFITYKTLNARLDYKERIEKRRKSQEEEG